MIEKDKYMKLHAGSLYKNALVLYGENVIPHIIFFEDGKTEENLQWDIYCNDVEFEEKDSERGVLTFNGNQYQYENSWIFKLKL